MRGKKHTLLWLWAFCCYVRKSNAAIEQGEEERGNGLGLRGGMGGGIVGGNDDDEGRWGGGLD